MAQTSVRDDWLQTADYISEAEALVGIAHPCASEMFKCVQIVRARMQKMQAKLQRALGVRIKQRVHQHQRKTQTKHS
jgi:hypothetical protein